MQQRGLQFIKKNSRGNALQQLYSPQKGATVTTDSSGKAVGGLCSQKRHPVIFVLRKLTPAEQGYSNIEREALVFVFVVTTLTQFLLRRQFTLETDHKPFNRLYAPAEDPENTIS